MKKSTLRLGRSKFLIFSLLFFIVGLFLAEKISLDLWWLSGIIIGLILGLISFWPKIYFRLIIFILISFCLGLGYFHFWDYRQKAVTTTFDKEITIEGQVVGFPDISGSQSRYLLKWQDRKIQLTINRYPEYQYGDKLKIKGVLKPPNDYLFHQGVLGAVYFPENVEKTGTSGNIFLKTIFNFRKKFEDILNRSLNEPYSSFAAGVVLGSKRNIPDSLMSAFNRTGTTHIIAVSGYNVTIMIVYIGLFLGIFSRKLKFWGSLFVIITFVLMTGASASVLRAGILAGLMAWGYYEGRRINMTILLLLTASLMLLFNPYMLEYDISFQLSFLAFMGLVYFSPILASWKIFKWLPFLPRNLLTETLGAQIFVLPILIYYFGRFSLVAPIVNVLILWLIPASMLIIFMIGLAGFIFLPLAQVIGFFGWLLLKYILIIVERFSALPWASFEIKTSQWWWMVLFYAIIGTLLIKFKKSNDESS